MNFWDLFVCRVWAGCGGDFDRAADLLHISFNRGLLQVAGLADRSLLLLLLTCPDGSPVQTAAEPEYRARNRSGPQEWGALREALPPRLAPLARQGASLARADRRRQMALRQLSLVCVPELRTYLLRLGLFPEHVVVKGEHLFVTEFARQQVLLALDAPPDQAGEDAFLCAVYSLPDVAGWPAARGWPASPPKWQAELLPAERNFLEASLNLSDALRRILFLTFYAQLGAEQVAAIYHPHTPKSRPETVLARVRDAWVDAWLEVLGSMRVT